MFESESDDHNQNRPSGEKQSGPASPKNLEEIKSQMIGIVQNKKKKIESNQQLQRFKKVMAKSEIGNQIITAQEKIKAIPLGLEDDLDEAVLYAYFAVQYIDPHIFKIICTRTNKFSKHAEYHQLLGKDNSYNTLSKEASYSRFRLNQVAFQISIEKDYYDIAEHFISTDTVHITWDMVRKMLSKKQEYLVKRCVKFQTKFDPGSASIKKILFAGRSAAPLEDRTIKLVDFIQIMLELRWKTIDIVTILKRYQVKGKIDAQEIREMFLMFAMKRKIKLMSFLINCPEFQMEFQESNFIDVIENDAYDMGVLLYREYFLNINKETEKIINLLINSFTKSNGMLEAKCFLLKRFMPKMNFEQATKFLEIVEQRVFDSSKGNILVLTMNVVKASCLLVELLAKIKSHFAFLARRTQEIRQKITKISNDFMFDVQSEEEMRFFLLEKDFDERDALNIIYDYEIIELLQHPFAQNIVQQIWTSQYNNSHSVFTVSTCHTLLFNFNHCRYDEEESLRFYKCREAQKQGCHPFQFQVWRYSGSSRHIIETITSIGFAILMHVLITQHMSYADFLLSNRTSISDSYSLMKGFDPITNGTVTQDQMIINDALYSMWNLRIQKFENEAMILTYLMEFAWFYFFQHIFNVIFATKNKRIVHFVNIDNFLDFMVFAVGWSYVSIIYKSYRLNTFLQYTTPYTQAELYWQNYIDASNTNENIVLLVYALVLWSKVFMKMRLLTISGPLFAVLQKLLYDMLIFGLFYFAEIFLFAIVGIVLFNDLTPFSSLSSALFILFKATIQDYDVDMMNGAKIGNFFSYCYFIAFLILNLVLVVNLIVGLQSYAYKQYSKKRDILMMISTLSVREVTQADDKYSAIISAPFPLCILNFAFGGIVIGMKSQTANICLLMVYFAPVALICFIFFFVYQILILPFCYVKIVGHKFALMIKTPEGQGARSTLDRAFQALFFILFGLLILALDSVIDLFWFLKHMFTMNLDKSHLQTQQSTQLHRRTYKKMFDYFEQKNEQLVPETRVAEDLREYLDVTEGIQCMIYGKPKEIPNDKVGLYMTYAKKMIKQATGENNGKRDADKPSRDGNDYDVEQVVKEFEVVKSVLLNNSFPVNMQEIQQNSVKKKGWGKKLLLDKKTFFNLLVDLERMRKVLNLKKCFFIFNIPYEGKPNDMNAWHLKVEARVSQTLKFLNTARLLKIIGYDPVQHIKIDNINFSRDNLVKNLKLQGSQADLKKSPSQQINSEVGIQEEKNQLQTKSRVDNLQQNMQFMMNKYQNAGRQMKEIADILKKLNNNSNIDNTGKINQNRGKQPVKKPDSDDSIEFIKKASEGKENKFDSHRQHQVNYISPSKIGVIIQPDRSKEGKDQRENDYNLHYSNRSHSEAVVTEEDENDIGIHKDNDQAGIRIKKKNSMAPQAKK